MNSKVKLIVVVVCLAAAVAVFAWVITRGGGGESLSQQGHSVVRVGGDESPDADRSND